MSNPLFVRGSFEGIVSLSVPAGRHPLGGGIRRLTIAGIQGVPKVGGVEGTVSLEAPGVRLTLRGAEAHVDGALVRVIVRRPRP